MKKTLFHLNSKLNLLKIICLLMLVNTQIQAQCLIGTPVGATITPVLTFSLQVHGANAPMYYDFPAQAGINYTFTYCQGGGSYVGDPYLTITNSLNVAQASNDDFCSLGSNIYWSCNATGPHRIVLSGCCPCANHPGGTLAYRADGLIIPVVPCAGAPDPNSVITPSFQICPGSSIIANLANTYTVNGITYAWQFSTVSAVGPWTAINNATLTSYTTTPLFVPTFYSAIITCTNSNQSIVATTASVNIALTTTNTVPYFEGFEAIGMNNMLPNCSWSSTGTGGACQTFTAGTTGNRTARSGNKFGVFNSSTGTFYSNGVQLNSGITYSTSLWFKTDVAGVGLNWKNLAISAGPAQSAAGQVTVCSTNGVAISGAFKLLSNTFTVGSSGMYYFGVSATYSGAGAPYLTWDDFEVIAPCQLNPSSLVISSPVSTICAGQPIVLSVSGSANSFSWNNGSTGNLITAYPSVNTTYVVTATSTLTGCLNTASKLIVVNPLPVVSILTNNQSLCLGSSANLLAVGANTYLWSNGSAGAGLSVSPLVSTTYSVYGTNNFGCSSTTSQLINVSPLPVVTAVSVPSSICKGEGSTLVASGAANYSWNSNNNYIQGGQVNVSPTASTMYTLTGTINGCTSTAFVSVIVYECVGINSLSSNNNDLKVYPNPSSSDITVELKKDGIYKIELIDVTGKVVLVKSTEEEKLNLNINFLSNGVYYLKAKSQNTMNVVKIIKN